MTNSIKTLKMFHIKKKIFKTEIMRRKNLWWSQVLNRLCWVWASAVVLSAMYESSHLILKMTGGRDHSWRNRPRTVKKCVAKKKKKKSVWQVTQVVLAYLNGLTERWSDLAKVTHLEWGGASIPSPSPHPPISFLRSPCLLLAVPCSHPHWGGREAQRGVTRSPPQPLHTSPEYRQSGSRENFCALRHKGGMV